MTQPQMHGNAELIMVSMLEDSSTLICFDDEEDFLSAITFTARLY